MPRTPLAVQLQLEALGEGGGVLVGLGRQIAGVHPDHRNWAFQAAHQVQADGGLDPEAGGEHEALTELLLAPAHAPERIAPLQLCAGVGGIENGGGRDHAPIFQCGGGQP